MEICRCEQRFAKRECNLRAVEFQRSTDLGNQEVVRLAFREFEVQKRTDVEAFNRPLQLFVVGVSGIGILIEIEINLGKFTRFVVRSSKLSADVVDVVLRSQQRGL